MRALSCLLLSLLSVAWVGCTSSSTATELTLTIESDLTVPDQLDRVTVSVIGQEVATDPSADLRDKPLPRSLTLVHDSGPLGPLQITVRGWSGSQLVVQKDLQAWFVASTNTVVTVELESACRDMLCSSGMTCEDGRCVPVTDGLDGGGIVPHDATVGPPKDASMADAQRPGSDAALDDAALDDAALPDGATPPGPPADASTQPDASATDSGFSGLPDAGPPPVSAGAPPVCTVSLPVLGDSYQVNTVVALHGSCNDPETGPLGAGLSWASQLDGPLGAGGTLNATLHQVGAHHLTLCAPDPRDSSVVGCAAVDVTVTLLAQPTATINAISQSGSSSQPFSSAAGIVFSGAGTGAGVTLSWSDDLQGALGSGPSVTLGAPLVGRHNITLTATDRNGVAKTALRLYLVVAAGETNLVSPFTTVNATLDTAGDPGVTMIASDPQSRAYVPNSSGVLYRFDGNALASPATIAIGQPPLVGLVQDAQLLVEKNLTYLATTQGLTVCGENATVGVAEPCTTYGRGLALQSINVLSVLRMPLAGMMGPMAPMEILLEGTDSGVFIPDVLTGSTRGTVLLRGRKIYDMVALGSQAALAVDNGLYLLAPATQMTVRFTTADGLLSNQLSSLAVGGDGSLWIGTSAGLNHYQPSASKWTSWTSDGGLAGNRVNGVAVQHVTALTPARDVVWIASSGGVTRLDTLSNTLQRFTTADGLPSNEVLAVNVLANGIKLFGTSKGLGHFVGP